MLIYKVISLQQATATQSDVPPFLFDERGQKSLNAGNEARRRETRAAYCLLHSLLVEQGLIAADSCPQIAHHEHGKPCLEEYPDLHFNLSHCHTGVAAIVSTDGEVGIDIESRRKIKEALIHKVCSDDEAAAIAAADDPELLFLHLWTRKEALLKQIGTGIDRDLRPLLAPDNPILQTVALESHHLPELDGYLSLCYEK